MSPEIFRVADACLQLGLRGGAILLRNLKIAPASGELRSELAAEVERVRREFSAASEIRRLPEIAKLHEILRAVGVKPRSHPPSTQKLLELAAKRGRLPDVNNLVDAYNLVSVRTRCSLGAHDFDRLATPVQLGLFDGDESFRPLGSEQDKPINRGEFGYVDARRRVICRLDSLQADFSKVTSRTTTALLIIESTTVHDAERLREVFDASAEAVSRYCSCEVDFIQPAW